MTAIQLPFTGFRSFPIQGAGKEEMAHIGVHAIFHARADATRQEILSRMERRDRIVLLLLDGKRSLQDIARLTHRSEVDIAHTLVKLLLGGYIEFLGA